MNNIYLLNSNILIYYFNDDPTVQPIFQEIQAGNAIRFYCPITWVELLCYPDLTEDEANLMREFLRTLSCVSLIESVLDCAAEIRRNYRVRLADALIAACADLHHLTVEKQQCRKCDVLGGSSDFFICC